MYVRGSDARHVHNIARVTGGSPSRRKVGNCLEDSCQEYWPGRSGLRHGKLLEKTFSHRVARRSSEELTQLFYTATSGSTSLIRSACACSTTPNTSTPSRSRLTAGSDIPFDGRGFPGTRKVRRGRGRFLRFRKCRARRLSPWTSCDKLQWSMMLRRRWMFPKRRNVKIRCSRK